MFTETKKDGESQVLEPWRQALLDAADYMERHGHCKFVLQDSGGAVCLQGALNEVCGFVQMVFLIHHVEKFLGVTNAVAWNNEPERTGAEVVAAMRACAAQ